MRRNLIACSLAAALAASAGCYADETVTAAPAYGYTADPELETIGPDVQVVDDLDYPVFFSGGFYWMYDGGFWFRSHSWRSGWVGVAPVGVPFGIRGIRAPLAYSHWHGGYAHGGVAYHGGYRGGYHPGARPSFQPHVVARGGGAYHGGGAHGGHH